MKEFFSKARLVNAWRSTTIWFNAILLAVIPFLDILREEYVGLQPYLSQQNFKRVAFVVFVVNILLRFRTTKDLAHK